MRAPITLVDSCINAAPHDHQAHDDSLPAEYRLQADGGVYRITGQNTDLRA